MSVSTFGRVVECRVRKCMWNISIRIMILLLSYWTHGSLERSVFLRLSVIFYGIHCSRFYGGGWLVPSVWWISSSLPVAYHNHAIRRSIHPAMWQLVYFKCRLINNKTMDWFSNINLSYNNIVNCCQWKFYWCVTKPHNLYYIIHIDCVSLSSGHRHQIE